MLKTPYSFSLDIIKPTKIPIMEFYQTDVNTSQMDISITNNDEVVDLTGHTLILNIKKADGTEIQNLATISDTARGIVNVSLTTQSLTAIGECRVQLTIFLGETRKSTHEFKYYVKASMLNTEVPLSSNEYGLLLQLIDDVQEVENILNTSEATRVIEENKRIELYNSMSTLQTELNALQVSLNSLEGNVETSEYAREYNEQQREILKGQLDTLKAELELLQTELNDLNSTVNSNETTRQANEEERIELKGQLEGLKGSLESLENTVNSNEGVRNSTVYTKVSEVDNKIVSYDAVILDIQNRFALLSSSVQQASEVINARTSTIRNKTFVDLDSRIEEIEKDVLTSQSTSVVDSVSPVNHLTNSLDGATDLTIKGQSLVNNVKNGNFTNGTGGWVVGGASLSANNNVLTVTGSGTIANPYTQQDTNTPCIVNKKIFLKAKIRVTNANCSTINIKVGGTTGGTNATLQTINNPVQNQYYTLYGIHTISDITGNIRVFAQHTYPDTTSANGKVMEVQEVMALDLTSLGLDTKTADEINAMLPSYFEGIASVEGGTTVIKSVGENLFDGQYVLGDVSTTGIIIASADRFVPKNPPRVQANKTYRIYKSDGGTVDRVTFRDKQGNILSTNLGSSIPIVAPTGSYDVIWRITSGESKVMLNEGSVAKPYTPYKESKIQLSDYIESQYFPLRSVSPTVYDEVTSGKVYKRIKEKILQTSDIINVITTQSELDFATISQPSDIFGYPLFSEINGVIIIEGITQRTNETINSVNMLGKFTLSMSSGNIRIGVTKGTTLAQAQAQLTGKKLLYQLATPTEITLDRKINLPIFKNGSIIQEPSKMYAKLSYTFPLNMGRSVESIVNNLSWIKDNQQFIMSYLLELDTRLTLGGH